MRQISVDELKVIQLDILSFVDGFCRKNNIKYWMILSTKLHIPIFVTPNTLDT